MSDELARYSAAGHKKNERAQRTPDIKNVDRSKREEKRVLPVR